MKYLAVLFAVLVTTSCSGPTQETASPVNSASPSQLVTQPNTPIYVREVVQLPQPWIETDSGAEHVRPEYAAKDPVKISLVERSFDIHSRKAGSVIRLTVRHESKTTLDLSIALDTETERLKRVQVPEPRIRSENHVEKSVQKNIWTPVFREDGYAGSTWELWWGDEPPGK